MIRFLLSIFLMAALSFTNSCGTGEQARAAKNALEASKRAYERCLKEYPADPSRCEALKRVYETDCLVYQDASKGGGPTTSLFIEMGTGK